jgi:hypothetical protein
LQGETLSQRKRSPKTAISHQTQFSAGNRANVKSNNLARRSPELPQILCTYCIEKPLFSNVTLRNFIAAEGRYSPKQPGQNKNCQQVLACWQFWKCYFSR